MRARVAVVALVVAAGALGFAACGSDDAGLGPTDVEGEWAGTTSQGRGVAFTVTSAGVIDAQFAYEMTGSCTFNAVQALTTDTPLNVVDGRFAIARTQVGQSVFLSGTGEFTSRSEATGTIVLQHAPCGDTLNLSWNATKQPAN